MAINIARYQKPTQLDDFFRNFLWQPVGMFDERGITIKTDIAEENNAYIVKADIPGAKKEDIDVKINGNQIFINAEIRPEKEESLVHSERYYGQISRSFTFDQDINASGAEAKYENGVLQLTLPKQAEAPLKQIKIS